MINRGFSKFIWFYLIHKDKGIVEIPNPIGWRQGNSTSKRENDHSISIIIGNSLEYYGLGLEIIKDLRYNYGVDEKVELLCETRNPANPKTRKTVYRGVLDLSSFEIKDNKCKVNFTQSNLEKVLKAKRSQKIELERSETLIGTTASTLQTKDINVLGRSIFLESKLTEAIDPDSNILPNLRTPYNYDVDNVNDGNKSGVTVYSRLAFPLDVKYSSHLDDVTAIETDSPSGGLITSKRGGDAYFTDLINASFFTQSEFDRVLNIEFDLKFSLNHGISDEFIRDTFTVYLRKHSQTDETLDNFNTEYNLFERFYTSSNYEQDIHVTASFSTKNTPPNPIELKKGETLSLHILFKSNLGTNPPLNGDPHSRCNFNYGISTVSIKEDNTTPTKTRKTIKAYDFGKRLIELITGNANHFYAPILDTGEWKNITLSSGLWIRGFYGADYGKLEENADNPNDRQRIKASLNDFINFCDAKLGLTSSFKTIDGVERICFEPIKNKYRNRILITLTRQPFDFQRKVADNMLYTSCKFGDKFADVEADADLYEEIYGLAEYNTLSEWSTELTIDENIYSKVSEYRSDAIGKTLALKKSIEDYPNTDTRFDESMFMFHVVDIDATTLEERTWTNDFTEAPKNIYAPDDATNLLFTPKQMFKRHDFLFNTELKESIKYLSGRGNNNLITTNGSDITTENEDVAIASTSRQKFFAEEISFSYPYSNDVVNQIKGQTTINGEEILNAHGLIQFKDENGLIELGYLKEVKEENVLKFKIIAINPITQQL